MANRESMQGNQNAVKTGVEGAIRRIKEGKPFIGLAAEAEKTVKNELAVGTINGMVMAGAIRAQAACNMAYDAMAKAAEDGDELRFNMFMQRYGWLQGIAFRAWAQLEANRKQDEHTDALDVINKYRKGEDNE